MTTLEYTMADVGGEQYLLPSRSETLVVNRNGNARNVTEFREYRKFGSESSITFGVPK